ncbi:hypothetical protein ACOSQ3_023375 [Xanthoceras sorbifolium]
METEGGKGVTSEFGSNLGNLSKGGNGSRKDNDGFRYNIQSNRANSKVGGSRFDVLGEVEDDTTKGSHGHSIKIQSKNNSTTHKKDAVNSNIDEMDTGHIKITTKVKQKCSFAREAADTTDMKAEEDVGVPNNFTWTFYLPWTPINSLLKITWRAQIRVMILCNHLMKEEAK